MNTEKLHEIKPTVRWKNSEYPYQKEIILQSEKALDSFISSLKKLGDTPSSQDILGCVQAVVVEFNEIDDRHCFIETVEREDLCDFIYIAARAAGLEAEDDITETWRNW